MSLRIPRVALISNILCLHLVNRRSCPMWCPDSLLKPCGLSVNPETLWPCAFLLISIPEGSLPPPPMASKWPPGAELQRRRAADQGWARDVGDNLIKYHQPLVKMFSLDKRLGGKEQICYYSPILPAKEIQVLKPNVCSIEKLVRWLLEPQSEDSARRESSSKPLLVRPRKSEAEPRDRCQVLIPKSRWHGAGSEKIHRLQQETEFLFLFFSYTFLSILD